MGNLRWTYGIVCLVLVGACTQSTSGAVATPTPSPSAVASPSPSPVAAGAILVGLSGVQADVTLVRTDGTVVASVPGGVPVGDELAIGAYVVAARDGSGNEWVVDRAGVVRDVAPTAAKLLVPGSGSPLVLSETTAIVGCSPSPSGGCVAQAINLAEGTVRALFTAAGPSTPRYGPALKVMQASTDLNTVWLRQVIVGATPKLVLVSVDLNTGTTTTHDLPAALLDDQDLTISRDGKWLAGQEAAGTNSAHLLIRHLHVYSMATGADRDVQGSALYVGGLRSPSVLFAPDSSRVAWWGGVDNGSTPQRVNLSLVGGTGRTLYPTDTTGDVNGINGVSWIDGSTIAVMFGGLKAVNADTGEVSALRGGIDDLLGALQP